MGESTRIEEGPVYYAAHIDSRRALRVDSNPTDTGGALSRCSGEAAVCGPQFAVPQLSKGQVKRSMDGVLRQGARECQGSVVEDRWLVDGDDVEQRVQHLSRIDRANLPATDPLMQRVGDLGSECRRRNDVFRRGLPPIPDLQCFPSVVLRECPLESQTRVYDDGQGSMFPESSGASWVREPRASLMMSSLLTLNCRPSLARTRSASLRARASSDR